ncbi:hypothetical protein PCH_Pc12g03840 [Penicillium rubens Wisconsin 54-1255]|uniref:Uncharacterized protein n=1 Tax=Penicillium rubens (strain ATCC 28089 / DSM 1075 / NRRL 1951 / Wisconsin 54-1255) TaxID=500485 RepID=B6GX04_PENRW|nr:hypothetical protein PCH_Pc12g03840 [Penicillium rubens Wisconsin 54-1255]
MDLNEADIDHSGFYTDGRSQAISLPFIPLPRRTLAYEDHGSLQVVGQSPTSNPCLVDETLDITDSFDMQAYYYDIEASPLQTSHADLLNKEYIVTAQLSSDRGKSIFSWLSQQLIISIDHVWFKFAKIRQ